MLSCEGFTVNVEAKTAFLFQTSDKLPQDHEFDEEHIAKIREDANLANYKLVFVYVMDQSKPLKSIGGMKIVKYARSKDGKKKLKEKLQEWWLQEYKDLEGFIALAPLTPGVPLRPLRD